MISCGKKSSNTKALSSDQLNKIKQFEEEDQLANLPVEEESPILTIFSENIQTQDKPLSLFQENFEGTSKVFVRIGMPILFTPEFTTQQKNVHNCVYDSSTYETKRYVGMCSDQISKDQLIRRTGIPYAIIYHSATVFKGTWKKLSNWKQNPREDRFSLEEIGILPSWNDQEIDVSSIELIDESTNTYEFSFDLPSEENGFFKIDYMPANSSQSVMVGLISPQMYPCKFLHELSGKTVSAYVDSPSRVLNGNCQGTTFITQLNDDITNSTYQTYNKWSFSLEVAKQ